MVCPEFWLDYVHPLSGADEVSEENILNTKQYIVKDHPDNQKSEMHQTLINSLCQIHSVQYLLQVLHYTLKISKTLHVYNYVLQLHTEGAHVPQKPRKHGEELET
jgi:hypothetical protein